MCMFHHYELIHDTGYHMYMQCKDCHIRKIVTNPELQGNEPDLQWIVTGKFAPPKYQWLPINDLTRRH